MFFHLFLVIFVNSEIFRGCLVQFHRFLREKVLIFLAVVYIFYFLLNATFAWEETRKSSNGYIFSVILLLISSLTALWLDNNPIWQLLSWIYWYNNPTMSTCLNLLRLTFETQYIINLGKYTMGHWKLEFSVRIVFLDNKHL